MKQTARGGRRMDERSETFTYGVQQQYRVLLGGGVLRMMVDGEWIGVDERGESGWGVHREHTWTEDDKTR